MGAYPEWTGDWDRVKSGDLVEREDAVRHYSGLAEAVARKLYRTLPYHVEREDIIQLGMLGLLKAVEDYRRPNHTETHDGRVVSFETYLVPKVRGMIIDELRKLDWAPRSVRKKNRLLDRAAEMLENELGREPTPTEIAESMGLTTAEVLAARHDSIKSAVVSLDDTAPWDEDGDTPREPASDDREATEMSILVGGLVRHLRSMPHSDQVIVALYYYENMTMSDISRVLGIPEAKVSKDHKRISLEIRSYLAERLT